MTLRLAPHGALTPASVPPPPTPAGPGGDPFGYAATAIYNQMAAASAPAPVPPPPVAQVAGQFAAAAVQQLSGGG